jgi:hypothetical protein
VSSRLAVDRWGRTIVVVTSSTDGLPIGHVFVVLDWTGFFTPRGRAPTAREKATAKPPYSSPRSRWNRPQVEDDQLDEAAAVAAAYAEQRREPADLINVAA